MRGEGDATTDRQRCGEGGVEVAWPEWLGGGRSCEAAAAVELLTAFARPSGGGPYEDDDGEAERADFGASEMASGVEARCKPGESEQVWPWFLGGGIACLRRPSPPPLPAGETHAPPPPPQQPRSSMSMFASLSSTAMSTHASFPSGAVPKAPGHSSPPHEAPLLTLHHPPQSPFPVAPPHPPPAPSSSASALSMSSTSATPDKKAVALVDESPPPRGYLLPLSAKGQQDIFDMTAAEKYEKALASPGPAQSASGQSLYALEARGDVHDVTAPEQWRNQVTGNTEGWWRGRAAPPSFPPSPLLLSATSPSHLAQSPPSPSPPEKGEMPRPGYPSTPLHTSQSTRKPPEPETASPGSSNAHSNSSFIAANNTVKQRDTDIRLGENVPWLATNSSNSTIDSPGINERRDRVVVLILLVLLLVTLVLAPSLVWLVRWGQRKWARGSNQQAVATVYAFAGPIDVFRREWTFGKRTVDPVMYDGRTTEGDGKNEDAVRIPTHVTTLDIQ